MSFSPDTSQRPLSAALRGIGFVVAFLVAVPELPAQSWSGNASGNWHDPARWSPATVPNAVDANATLGDVIASNRTVTVNAVATVGSLAINSNFRYTLSGSTLTFSTSSGSAQLSFAGTGGGGNGHTLNAPISLADPLLITTTTGRADINSTIATGGNTITVTAGNITRFDGAISGSGGFIKEGSSEVIFGGAANTFTGATQVRDGTLSLSKSNNVTSVRGPLTIGDGVGSTASAIVRVTSNEQINNASSVVINSDGRLLINNSRSERIGALNSTSATASVVLNPSSVLSVGSGTFNGVISGTGRLTKVDTGKLTLGGANTYTGRTEINGGILSIATDSALGTAPGAATGGHLRFNGGTLETTANMTLAANRRITLNSGGGTFDTASGTTLTYGGIISGAGALVKAGTGTLRLAGPGNSNTYRGGTVVNAGTLLLEKTPGQNAVGSSGQILVNSGGTLLLGNRDQIATTSNLVMAGGTFSTGAGYSETLGSMTLTANSVIALGSALHNLRFGASNLALWSPAAVLVIQGWQGIGGFAGTAGRIFFGSDSSALTADQLAQINFAGFGGAQLLSTGELVPVAVPEPGVVVAAFLVVAAVVFRERSTLQRLFGSPALGFGVLLRPAVGDRSINSNDSGRLS